MNAAAHLVTLVSEPLWPALQSLVHWHRHAGGVQRLFLLPVEDSRGSRDPSRRLERFIRFIREIAPEIPVERAEGPIPDPAGLRAQLDAWQGAHPGAAWILDLSGLPLPALWAAEAWRALPGCRITFRNPERDWVEIHPSTDAPPATTALPEIRRGITDDLPLPGLVRMFLPDDAADAEYRFAPTPLQPLPVIPLTEAAVAADWRWAEAFTTAGLDPGDATPHALFERYIGALTLALGLRPPFRRIPSRARAADPASPPVTASELWINQGGRLVILDLDLAADDESPSESASPLAASLIRASGPSRPPAGAGTECVLIRPRQRATPLLTTLARALGIACFDQDACHTLPSRLAALVGVPLTEEGAETERRLQVGLSRTGRTRVFGDEPAVLRQPDRPGDDPLWTRVDAWLDRVMRERGQNWLLWTHRGRAFLRVPASGRPAAAQEWRLLAVCTSGHDDREVTGRPTPDGAGVVVEFPDAAGPGRRLAGWLQPFANRTVTFAEAQARFAAQARVEAEATHSQAATPRPAPAPAPAPAPSPSPSPSRPVGPPPAQGTARPRPPAPAGSPPGGPKRAAPARPRTVSLEDLDKALNDALGN